MADTETTETTEKEEADIVEVSDGFIGVLQIIANKLSKKAAVVGLSMVLIYLLSATPMAPKLVFSVCVLAGLGVFYSMLQWILDRKQQKARLKIVSKKQVVIEQKPDKVPDKTT